MAMADRRAEVTWEGPLNEGAGELALLSSEGGSFPVTWASRVESPDGRTSPEELLAAAHASCYSMALSAALGRAGTPPERLRVRATVSLNPKEGGGIQVTDSALEVTGVVPGLDEAAFRETAEKAEQACPISNTIRGNVAVTVTASLEGS
jgi:lipoyl-dependent peroxiredoxin